MSVEQRRLLKIIRVYRKSRDEGGGHGEPGVGRRALPQEAPPAPGVAAPSRQAPQGRLWPGSRSEARIHQRSEKTCLGESALARLTVGGT